MLLVALTALSFASASSGVVGQVVYRSITSPTETRSFRNGQKVRLVQIDTPEVFFGTDCYGRQTSATAKRLLPEGVRVRLLSEPRPTAWTTSGGSCATSGERTA